MAGRLTVIILALVIILHYPTPAVAPVIFPGVVQEHQEPEPEPEPEPMVFTATAYTWTGNRTATGTWPSRGTVAVDPLVIPLGTELHIEGYGPAVAADTGGDIQGQIIDLYMDSYQECIEWGRRQVEVRVME
jgi:3D (Asp-Asp-Asp) domain-containing protein